MKKLDTSTILTFLRAREFSASALGITEKDRRAIVRRGKELGVYEVSL